MMALFDNKGKHKRESLGSWDEGMQGADMSSSTRSLLHAWWLNLIST
jgi:hypothetical protein